MLFDLRGTGRRRIVKTVYISLALLMGGSTVAFGTGSDVGGGLVDALTGSGARGDDGSQRLRDRADETSAQLTVHPKDAQAWALLARTRVQLAGAADGIDASTGAYTAQGKRELRHAADAWNRHLALAPADPDARTAALMVQAHLALGQPADATAAQDVVTQARPSAATFAQLATYAYAAGQTRKAELARAKALELTPKDLRETLRGQLDQAKAEAGAGARAGS
jgi:hypothetical protein